MPCPLAPHFQVLAAMAADDGSGYLLTCPLRRRGHPPHLTPASLPKVLTDVDGSTRAS